jgi:USP6 N-terminal-like protein
MRMSSYGFFTTPSHDRLMLLSSQPLTRPHSRPPPVTTTAESTLPPLKSSTPLPTPEREISRASKWARMLEAQARDGGKNVAMWGVKASKAAKLRERTYKGIPDCWRSAAWEMMMNKEINTSERELCKLSEEFQDALNKQSSYDVQIDLDVPRTISGHVMFRTRYGQGYVVF